MTERRTLQTLHRRTLAPHEQPPSVQQIWGRSMVAGVGLAVAGVVIAVAVLLVSALPEFLLEGAAVGALYGAVFGFLFALTGGLVRRLWPNVDSGRETTPAFLVAMIGAGLAVRMLFGGTALAVTLMVFWGAVGVAVIAVMLHHEFTTNPNHK